MCKPWLLDLFAGAGGAGEGYRRAGFHVVGVDLDPKPLRHNPHEWYVGDALAVLDTLLAHQEWNGYRLEDFAAIHASPKCQRWSLFSRNLGRSHLHPDQIDPLRPLLRKTGLPYVVENVEGAPLENPVTLCGSGFGMEIVIDGQRCHLRRHRLFESNVLLFGVPCNHRGPAVTVTGHGTPQWHVRRFGRCIRIREFESLMGIDWMNRDELSQAIPPAYTEWIGAQLLSVIGNTNAASRRSA